MSQKKNQQVIFKDSLFKVVSILFEDPAGEFHLRGLSKASKLSTTAVAQAVKVLQANSIINVAKTPIVTKITCNLESPSYQFHKRIFNLHQLHQLGVVTMIQKNYAAKTVVLFGSYAQGEDLTDSDIDLLVVSNQRKKSMPFPEKALKRNINVVVLPTLKNSSPAFKNSIANGIVLHGHVSL